MASINTVLTEVGPSVAGVTQSVGRIKTDLTTVTSDLTAAVTTCRQNAGMPGAPDCDPIMNVRDATSMAMGMIPDVSNLLSITQCIVSVCVVITMNMHQLFTSVKLRFLFRSLYTDPLPLPPVLSRYLTSTPS